MCSAPSTTSGATRILIADDDATFRCALRAALHEEAYDVVEASDGAMALDLLAAAATAEEASIDVVVLDCLMPFCSGLGILEIMRRFENPPPTLLVTSFVDRSVDIVAHRLGAFGVIHKPFELDVLLATVLAAARSRHSSR